MRRLFIPLAVSALSIVMVALPARAQEPSSLRQQMTQAEFHAAGLDKLAPSELAALERWLRSRTDAASAPLPAPVAPATPVAVAAPVAAAMDATQLEHIREQAREEGRQEVVLKNRGFLAFGSDEPIESVLPGPFPGFAKGRQYTLANGQVWEQTDAARLDGARRADAEVSIKPGVMGVWYMRVKGFNTAAKVRRIK